MMEALSTFPSKIKQLLLTFSFHADELGRPELRYRCGRGGGRNNGFLIVNGGGTVEVVLDLESIDLLVVHEQLLYPS